MNKIMRVLLFSLLLGAMLAQPVAAKPPEPVGERISLWVSGTQTFAAGAPFYIRHGHVQQLLTDGPRGAFGFALTVDGQPVKPDAARFVVERDPKGWGRLWLFNFPEGMTGEHTFVGSWTQPCQWALDNAGYEGVCEQTNQPVETYRSQVVVIFE